MAETSTNNHTTGVDFGGARSAQRKIPDEQTRILQQKYIVGHPALVQRQADEGEAHIGQPGEGAGNSILKKYIIFKISRKIRLKQRKNTQIFGFNYRFLDRISTTDSWRTPHEAIHFC